MSNWKQKIQDMEIAPPKKIWEEIEQKRQRPRWVKWGVIVPVLAVSIAVTLQAVEKQKSHTHLTEPSIVETKSAEPTNSFAKDPIKVNQKISSSQPSAEVSSLEQPITEPKQNNISFPYNGRIVTTQNEHNTTGFSINPAENTTNTYPMDEVTEEIKPEIENTLEDSSSAASHEEIEIPNVFSPNGDGWNDEFSPADYLPEGSQLLEWKLFRNGKFVQSWRDNSPWKGLDGGDFPMSNGLYQYVIYYATSTNEIKSFSGNISIQR
jgi:hypothetical protein